MLAPLFLLMGLGMTMLGVVRLRFRDWADRPFIMRNAYVVRALTGWSIAQWRRNSRRRDVLDALVGIGFGVGLIFVSLSLLFGWGG